MLWIYCFFLFFFKQKTAYEMRISDWSSDVCSSDLAGRVESGSLAVGDTLLFSPSNKTARVRSLEAWPDDASPESAGAGQAVGITLDEQLFVERGEMASHVENPPKLSTLFHARLFWPGHKPLTAGSRCKLHLPTQEDRQSRG